MIDFKEIVGHTKPKQILKNRIKNEKIGHSYLFVGNEGIGKKLTAIAFSKAINCKNISEEQDPCNKCSSCQQIEKNSSADFSIISPVDSVIKIEKIREVKSNIYLHPLTNKKKIYIFDNAEKMTTQASNSLLKILEEPPEYAILILVTSAPDKILPTIISRCCRLVFKPLEINQQKKIISGNSSIDEKQLDNLIKLSHGSPGMALDLMRNQDKIKIKDNYIESLVKIKPEELSNYIFSSEKIFPDITNNFQDFVEMMVLWFRDTLLVKMNIDENQLFFQDKIESIRQYAQWFKKDKIILILEYLATIPEELEKHVNQNILLENFFIRLGD